MRWRTKLGWSHRGFRVASPAGARVALALLLVLPFVGDQVAFQHRMAEFSPDLKGWLVTAEQVLDDPTTPVYEHYHGFYIYPPFFLTLVAPLTALSSSTAAIVFETLKWIALYFALRGSWRLASRAGEDVPPIVALATLVFTWRFIENDLAYGNINLFVAWAVITGAWLVVSGRHMLGGTLVGVVACIKVTPALMLLYFAYKGWWRTWIGAALAGVVCLLVVPAIVFGWEANLHLLHGWYEAVVAGFLEKGAVRSEHTNQALVGILNRLLGDHPSIFSDDPATPHVYLTIVQAPQWARDVLRGVLTVGVLGGLAWWCRGQADRRADTLGYSAEIGLVLIAMLLLSGLTWKSHMVTLMLPYAALLAFVADGRHGAAVRRTVGAWLLASFVLCTLTSDIITPTGADYAEALGLPALGLAVAGAGLVRVRRAVSSATG